MKKYTIPSLLIVVTVLAVFIAFMPVDEAKGVHTTITADTVANVEDQERIVFYNIDATADINNFVLVPDNGVDIVGTITVTLIDEGSSGNSVVNCKDNTDSDLTINSALDAISDVGTIDEFALPNDCEEIQTDVKSGDHIIIQLYINNWPEV